MDGSGKKKHLTVRAPQVVVSGGTMGTPALLWQSGFQEKAYPWLGRNLSIHPAVTVMALMNEEVRGYEGIPQGYGVHQFHDDGILMEGGFTPLDAMAANISPVGHRFTYIMDEYNRLAVFGGMIADTSRGRVMRMPGSGFRVLYSLNGKDVARLSRVLHHLTDIFLAAGAREVFPMVGHWPLVRNTEEAKAFKRFQPHRLDLEVSAFHPLGTARMGNSRENSVVGPDHQVHGTRGLFVVDGSSVPSPLSVNPQLTIMALAHRAAESIARHQEGGLSASA